MAPGLDVASLTYDVAKDAWAIVGKGLDYNSTRDDLKALVEDLSPMVDRIEKSMKKMNHSPKHIEKLKKLLVKNTKALESNKIKWWNCVLAPWYQMKLSREHINVEKFVSVQIQIEMLHLLTKILLALDPEGRGLGSPTDSAHNNDRTGIFKDHLNVERFPPRFTVGLDGNFMKELKAMVLGDDKQVLSLRESGKTTMAEKHCPDLQIQGELQVLNLYGIPGSGKTTMAETLCQDLQVRDKFKGNIIFETLGSQIQFDESKLKEKLSKCREDPVLLVLDDVWPHSENIVDKLRLRSPDSRILVTSRAQIRTVRNRGLEMKLLSPEDAEKLFRYLIQPSDIKSRGIDFDNRKRHDILIKVVEGCRGLPLALQFFGRKLQGKRIEAFEELLSEWLQCDNHIINSHEGLLARLQNSVDESVKECFMDLGLFPEDQKIPINALIDMWTELFDLKEPASSSAMLTIHDLIIMNLAAGIIVRRIIGRDDMDHYYNNYFLKQHDLFRELAIHMSQQVPLEKRRSLIIDMYGNPNDPPKWWPKQPQTVVAPRILSISTGQNITPDWCNIQAAATVVLVLNLMTTEYTLPEFIKDMNDLKVLIVTNYGSCKTGLRNFKLLGTLLSLKTIRLQQVSIPSLQCDLKNLHKLSLYMCDVKNAFENTSIDFSKAMPKLEDLSIEYCKDLVELPIGLCNIVAMKKFTISSCHKFIILPEEIERLENLEVLRINYCADFEKMPNSITRLKNLSFLDISFCVSLKKLPDHIGELQNLTQLYMTGCPMRELPDSIMDFNKLKNVICDEYAYPLWEVIMFWFSGLDIMTADMEVNLNWLS